MVRSDWSYHNRQLNGEHEDENQCAHRRFEIDDGELHGESPGDRTLTIPCKSDPDLCMQLDARDAETSIPALLNGEHSVLTVPVTINNLMPGLCVLPDPKEPVGMAGYLSGYSPL